jgi:hypothetical protein
VSDILSLHDLHDEDRELLRGLAARMRKLREKRIPPVLPSVKPTGHWAVREALSTRQKTVAAPEIEPKRHWCTQCEKRVSAQAAGACTSKFCAGKVAFEVTA